MPSSLHDLAARAVSAARLFKASIYLAGALVCALIILWLTVVCGVNGFVLVLDALLAFSMAGYIVKASEIHAAGRRSERPDERQRYLESRQLYMPRPRERSRRRRDE